MHDVDYRILSQREAVVKWIILRFAGAWVGVMNCKCFLGKILHGFGRVEEEAREKVSIFIEKS